MAIQSLQFLQATNPYHSKGVNAVNNFEPRQAKPVASKPVDNFFKPTTEDYEKAQAYIDGNYNAGSVFAPQKTHAVSDKGAAFDGFTVPENNGTGELSPVYEPGERLLDFKC